MHEPPPRQMARRPHDPRARKRLLIRHAHKPARSDLRRDERVLPPRDVDVAGQLDRLESSGGQIRRVCNVCHFLHRPAVRDLDEALQHVAGAGGGGVEGGCCGGEDGGGGGTVRVGMRLVVVVVAVIVIIIIHHRGPRLRKQILRRGNRTHKALGTITPPPAIPARKPLRQPVHPLRQGPRLFGIRLPDHEQLAPVARIIPDPDPLVGFLGRGEQVSGAEGRVRRDVLRAPQHRGELQAAPCAEVGGHAGGEEGVGRAGSVSSSSTATAIGEVLRSPGLAGRGVLGPLAEAEGALADVGHRGGAVAGGVEFITGGVARARGGGEAQRRPHLRAGGDEGIRQGAGQGEGGEDARVVEVLHQDLLAVEGFLGVFGRGGLVADIVVAHDAAALHRARAGPRAVVVEFQHRHVQVEADDGREVVDEDGSVLLPCGQAVLAAGGDDGVRDDGGGGGVVTRDDQLAAGVRVGEPEAVLDEEPVWMVGDVEFPEAVQWRGSAEGLGEVFVHEWSPYPIVVTLEAEALTD